MPYVGADWEQSDARFRVGEEVMDAPGLVMAAPHFDADYHGEQMGSSASLGTALNGGKLL